MYRAAPHIVCITKDVLVTISLPQRLVIFLLVIEAGELLRSFDEFQPIGRRVARFNE